MKQSLLLISVAAGLVLGGCATTMERPLRGQPVAVAVAAIDDGVPDSAMDLPDGRRLFEWITTDVLILEDTGYDGDERWWTSKRQPLEAGSPNRNCTLQIFAVWDEARGTWVVERYRNLSSDSCNMRALPRRDWRVS